MLARGLALSAEPPLKPNDPQERGADRGHGQIVRREILGAVAAPRAEHVSGDETRDARVQVHDDTARKIHHTHAGEEAATPDPVRARDVDDKEPCNDEEQERREAHAVRDRTRDQRAGDDGERHLIGREQGLWKVRCKRVHRIKIDPGEEQLVEIAEIGAVPGEGQRVACHEPQDRDEHYSREALRHGCEQVLLAHETCVKHRKPGNRHQQHERGRCDHPCRVGGVDRARLRKCRRRSKGGCSGGAENPKAFHCSPPKVVALRGLLERVVVGLAGADADRALD